MLRSIFHKLDLGFGQELVNWKKRWGKVLEGRGKWV